MLKPAGQLIGAYPSQDALVEAFPLTLPLELTPDDSGVRLGSPYNLDPFAEARCITR